MGATSGSQPWELLSFAGCGPSFWLGRRSGKCGFRDFFPTLLDRYFSRRFELQKPKNENTADRSHHLVREHPGAPQQRRKWAMNLHFPS